MNEYDMGLINLKLSQIHNDILGLKLCMIIDNMYEASLISKKEYNKAINQEYKTVSEQITRAMKKE